MTITQAANALGLAPATVRTQARTGAIRAEKHGTQYWITPAAVEEYRATRQGRVGRKPGSGWTPAERASRAKRGATA